MAYSVKDRLKYIGTRQNQVRGELVTYIRGAAQIQIYQCPGHTDVQDLIPENVISVGRYVDFIFFTQDINLPGLGLTIPIRGDKVVWQGNVYVATPPMANEDVYNYTTMYKDRLRVHTILTATLNPP